MEVCTIDAYEIFMIGNAIGMGNGFLTVNRNYISSSNYIKKMSNINITQDE